MAELFKDIIPAILQTKEVVIGPENEKDYVPYIVNRALSYHRDCIFYANQMNMRPNVDGVMQNHYLLNTVRAWRRPFQKWQKLESNDDLDAISEYYGYSMDKAKEAFRLLSDEQIGDIKKRLDKGGLNDKYKSERKRGSTR